MALTKQVAIVSHTTQMRQSVELVNRAKNGLPGSPETPPPVLSQSRTPVKPDFLHL